MTRERRAMAVMAASLLLLAVAVGTSLRMQLAPRAVPAPPRQLAYDNGLVDALTGWISVYKIGDRSRSWLWLTADGGLTWKRSELAGAPIYTRFFDADHGVVVTEPAADGRNSAQLWATADAGAHWTRAPLPPAPRAAYPQAFFSDLEHGWEMRVGSRNELLRLYRTSDAGANWAGAGLGAGLPLPLTARMTFADAEHGLVFVRPDNRTLRVEATSDGGSTWIDTPLPDPAVAARTSMLPTSARLFAGGIGVFGVHVATAAFQDPVDYVYQTPDGGRSWSAPLPLPRPAQAQPASTFIGFASPSVWWVAAGSQVFVTEDGGRSWTRLSAAIPPGMYVAGLSAFDSRLAWAIATDTQLIGLVSAHPTVLPAPPRLFLTTDGGRSWSERQVPDTTGPRS